MPDNPKPIAQRVSTRTTPEAVLDAAEAFACEAFSLDGCTPTDPEAKDAARELRERLAESEAVGALVSDFLTLRGPQRDGLGWLLEAVIGAESCRLRAERLAVRLEDELPEGPLQQADALADINPGPSVLRDLARRAADTAPQFARESERTASGAETARAFRFFRRLERRRERGRPPSPVRLVAESVDAVFGTWPRGDRDAAAAALARDVLGADVTPESIRHLMAIHRRGSHK